MGPITGESTGIYPYGDQSQGSQRVYTRMGMNDSNIRSQSLGIIKIPRSSSEDTQGGLSTDDRQSQVVQ
eukprot:8987220-Pyramimonas_sp.AAC.2